MKVTTTYKIVEAADECGINPNIIEEYITYHWVNPADPKDLELDEEDLARIRLIWELKQDLGVNDESVPIILHLIDELNHLHLGLKNRN